MARAGGARRSFQAWISIQPTAPSPSRVTAKLAGGRAVTVAAESVDLDAFIETLEEVLGKARKARTQGIELGTFAKMLRDQAN